MSRQERHFARDDPELGPPRPRSLVGFVPILRDHGMSGKLRHDLGIAAREIDIHDVAGLIVEQRNSLVLPAVEPSLAAQLPG